MDVEEESSQINRDSILTHLINNDEIIFKNQQRDEADLTQEEKFQIAANIFDRNKVTFLTRFGKYLNTDQLKFFRDFDNEDVNIILQDLLNDQSERSHHLLIRNRRYEALNRLKQDSTYFSEIEMMKRNPLLYEQLVGQYLSEDEKKERDKVNTMGETSFVKILMEGIERDESETKRKKQEEEEDDVIEEDEDGNKEGVSGNKTDDEDEDTRPPYAPWGEILEHKPKFRKVQNVPLITATERKLLREEFVTTMYENFLEGKDSDFDYKNVDNNQQYDNIETLTVDAQEKYFSSESPEDTEMEETVNQESEDELDTYMEHIHHKLEMSEIRKTLKKL